MGIRRPSILKKIGQRRYALLVDYPTGKVKAEQIATTLRRQGFSARVVSTKQGWFVYHYPQYPRPRGYN